MRLVTEHRADYPSTTAAAEAVARQRVRIDAAWIACQELRHVYGAPDRAPSPTD